jgi:low temperature requirement protein LtrA
MSHEHVREEVEYRSRSWYLRMVSRDTREEHRASTPLELFFDLCFVVAVALAADNLHHKVATGHVGDGVFAYSLVFFAIWWAWMNFTWFASAYDTDDGLYRITTFVQMAGVLVMAVGVPRAFGSEDIGLMTIGYVIMRLALVTQWLRAAVTDPPTRPTALRYAIGVTAVQVLWVGRLFLPDDWFVLTVVPLIIAELLVPVWAERAARTTWHPHHIAERYGLFTIIVLGESILAATTAFQTAADADFGDANLVGLAIAALVIVFSMWWLYFDHAEHPEEGSYVAAFAWGYGHLFVFAAAAAVGAGIAVEVDYKTDVTNISPVTVALATGVPVALYLLAVWAIHVLPNRSGLMTVAFPVCAVLVLGAAFLPWSFIWLAVLLAALVALMVVHSHRQASDTLA